MSMKIIGIGDIEGFRLGNAEDPEKGTGCTVIISEDGAVGGVDVRGGGPATRETDLLRSENTVNAVNAVVLSGGSAFGLEAASGVMRELAERRIGFDVGDDLVVPIVCGASLYDLPVGSPGAFPDVEMGREAVRNAYEGLFIHGNHGAGTGATVGKMLGYDRAMKTGLGTFACGDGFVEVGAVVAVNACGDIYNGAGNIIAGLRTEDGSSIYGTIKTLKNMVHSNPVAADDDTSFINKADIESALAALESAYHERVSLSKAEETPGGLPESQTESAESPAEDTSYETTEVSVSETAPEVPVEVPDTDNDADAAERSTTEAVTAAEPAEATDELPSSELHEAPAETAVQVEEINEPVSSAVSEAALQETENENENEAEVPESPETGAEAKAEEPAGSGAVTEAAAEEEAFEKPVIELTREEMGYDITFNTTIGCLITNAELTKSQANKLASILHDAYARAIKPVHSTLDGDTIFVLSTGRQKVNFDAFAALATDVMQYAVIDGATSATGAYGLPASRDL